ncbi:MAG TPA: hypothetical protein VFV10_19150 [Gammaproteobacteria bacterium]|nr:hypothetical protein [Gammaproteobacteria bacterium]
MDSWFSEQFSHNLALLALLSVLSFLDPCIRRGKHRNLVMAIWTAVLVFGCACLAAAALAWLGGQPPFVVRPLGIAGLVITGVFGGLYRTTRSAYQEAELRRISALDIE